MSYLLYKYLVTKPRQRHLDDLRRIYHIPNHLSKNEDSEMPTLRLMKIIKDAAEQTTDPQKKTDLQHCEQIVRKMKDDKSFNDIYRALRLTGCQLIIKDAGGQLIDRFA